MIDEQNERAARVWREVCAAYEDGTAAVIDLPMRDMVIAGDQAATAVIAREFEALEAEVKRLREENYRAFTDGMEAAAQICGSLAEVEYDDADGFDAATGCEAAIMRVVKDQRREQAALGASHDADA